MSTATAPEAQEFQPYFVAYATAHDRSPADQLDHDKARWKGGCMTGFILWIGQQRAAFRKARPEAFLGDSIADYEAWGDFVVAQGHAKVALR